MSAKGVIGPRDRWSILSQFASSVQPVSVRLTLDGPVRALATELELVVAHKKLISLQSNGPEHCHALVLLLMTDVAEFEVSDARISVTELNAYQGFGEAYQAAELVARNLLSQLWPLGGLDGILLMNAPAFGHMGMQLPDSARRIGSLADGVRTVAQILHDAPYALEAVATTLDHLRAEGLVQVLGQESSSPLGAAHSQWPDLSANEPARPSTNSMSWREVAGSWAPAPAAIVEPVQPDPIWADVLPPGSQNPRQVPARPRTSPPNPMLMEETRNMAPASRPASLPSAPPARPRSIMPSFLSGPALPGADVPVGRDEPKVLVPSARATLVDDLSPAPLPARRASPESVANEKGRSGTSSPPQHSRGLPPSVTSQRQISSVEPVGHAQQGEAERQAYGGFTSRKVPPIPASPANTAIPVSPANAASPVSAANEKGAQQGEAERRPAADFTSAITGKDSSAEFEATLRAAAGVGSSKILLLASLVGAVVLVAVLFLKQSAEQESEPVVIPSRLPVVLAPVTTPTVAAIPEPTPPKKERRRRRKRYSLSNPPPVAGPSADERVREAERTLASGDLASADELLRRLRKQRPRDSAVWVLSGMLADEQSDMAQALKYTMRALRVNKSAYRAWVLKGVLEQTSDQEQVAVQSYREALSLEPNHAMSPELRVVVKGLED